MATAALKRSRRRLVELACICLVVALLGWFAFPKIEVVTKSEWLARDQIILLSSTDRRAKEVVFLAIDESSLKLDHLFPEDIADEPILAQMTSGLFPWPRPVYAAAIERILGAGARLVILDLVMDKARDGDAILKATLDRHPTQVVLASNYSLDLKDPAISEDDTPSMTMPSATLIPHPDDDPRVGYANFWPGELGVVRDALYATTKLEQLNRPSLPGEPVYHSLTSAALRQLGEKTPTAGTRRFLPFRFVTPDKILTVPFHAVFVPYEWRQMLKSGESLRDRIVMIGPSATRLQDFHVTTIGQMPGPLLHIEALLAALNDSFYQRGGPSARMILIFLASITAGIITWRFQRRPVVAFSSLLGASMLYVFAIYALAIWAGILLFPLQPTLTLLLAGTTCIAWNFAQERRDSGRMRSTLERYVSRNVVREILDNRDDFLNSLGGTRRPMTVFFSDVRGFTSFAEREDASAVVEQLNEYLGEMVAIIFRHQGTVDKFMGDGIMAVWGNVVSHGAAQDAAEAVHAALEMLERLTRLNEKWIARNLPPFSIGIGLHHGEAVFGNIGSAEKMEPTVIGDTVNLTSRVEGLTKKYGVAFCVTQQLAELVADQFLFRSVDLVQVVGKSRPVEILTVLGRRDQPSPEWITCYEGGVADFRARRFAEAAAQFRLSLQSAPDDKLCKIHLARCETFLVEPPPADWNGAEIATSK